MADFFSALEGWRKYIVMILITVLFIAGVLDESTYGIIMAALGFGSGVEGAGRYISRRAA